MKIFNTFVISLLVLLGQNLYSQESNTFEYINAEKVDNLSEYTVALNSSNLDKYRLAEERRILGFDSGLEVALFSVSEMKSRSLKIDESRTSKTGATIKHRATFKLDENGRLLEMHERQNDKRVMQQKLLNQK